MPQTQVDAGAESPPPACAPSPSPSSSPAPPSARTVPDEVACDRCRAACRDGLFTVAVAFRPRRSPWPPRPPDSLATFRLCPTCAAAVVQFISERG